MFTRLSATFTAAIALAGMAVAAPLEERLTSSFDADAMSLLIYPADCGPDEIHEDCDLFVLSCGEEEVDGLGARVERLGDGDLGQWLTLNGASLTLTNGSNTLEMIADSIVRDPYDGTWDLHFYPASRAGRWLKAIDRKADIVARTVRGEWIVPRAGGSDQQSIEAFVSLCVHRVD